MPPPIKQRVVQIKQRLLERSQQLREDIQRELRKCDTERYAELADRVADSGEESVADLLVDVDLAEITRDVEEFRDLESALLRLSLGTYGICADCEEPIDPRRLEAMPAASRCYRCQHATEQRGQREQHRTL